MPRSKPPKPDCLQPGFRFSLPDWPPGFVPQMQRTREVEAREASARGRQTAMDNGHTGSIPGRLSENGRPTLLTPHQRRQLSLPELKR